MSWGGGGDIKGEMGERGGGVGGHMGKVGWGEGQIEGEGQMGNLPSSLVLLCAKLS